MNFLKKFFSLILLSISFLLIVYIFYRSEIYHGGNKRDYYLIYYIIFSIFFFLSIITFFINEKIKEYLIILSLSSLIPLYSFEIYLTFIKDHPKVKLYETLTGKKWDSRNKYEIYDELKKKNNEEVFAVYPKAYQNRNFSMIPMSGISNAKTINCNENGYYSVYQSDRYGFNNPDNEWNKKEIEYFLVGDSFTHGACVNRPYDIASMLRSLSNRSVLNLGYGGNGPLMEYATLREYLSSNVKKVLWIYYEGNDTWDLKDEMKEKILLSYLESSSFTQNLKLKQKNINDLAINEMEIQNLESKKNLKRKLKFKIKKFLKLYNTRVSIFPEKLQILTAPLPDPKLKEILLLAKNLVMENNAKLYFVYLPDYYSYKINFNSTNYKIVKNIVNELNIPFIDIHKEVFIKEQNPLKFFPFELTGHYNIQGYEKVSEAIYKFTQE